MWTDSDEMKLTRAEVWAGFAFAALLTAAFLLLFVFASDQARDFDPGIWRNCGAMPGHKYLVCGMKP
jgi:hypothetical protein